MRDVKCIAKFENGLVFLSKDRNLKYSRVNREEDEYIVEEISSLNLGEYIPSSFLAEKLIVGTTTGFLIQLEFKNEMFSIAHFNKVHEQNISTIAFHKNLIITSSWDNTICFVDGKNLNMKKRISQISSWKMENLTVNFKNKLKEILVCTDIHGNVIFFDEFTEIYRYKIHATVIRTFLLMENELTVEEEYSLNKMYDILKKLVILSCSNSGVMLMHNSNQLFKFLHLPSLIFEIFKIENGYLILSDRNLIYSVSEDFKIQKYFFTEGETNWSGCIMDDCLIFGSNDGSIGICNIQKNKLLHNRNAKEKIIKNKDGTLLKICKGEIFEKAGSEWKLIGSQVQQNDILKEYIYKNVSNKKHIFNVELTGKVYQLEYRDNETPETAAQRFIISNNLDSSYDTEIIDFINKNFKSANISSLTYKGLQLYTSINIDGISKILKGYEGWEFINELLNRCHIKQRSMNINDDELIRTGENILRELFKSVKQDDRFAILDIVRYLSLFEGIRLDYFYFLNGKFISRKEEIIFLRLLCNLFNLNLVNMEIFTTQVKNLIYLNMNEKSEFFTFLSKK